MSCNNWEAGKLKLSCKEYGKFKKAFRDRWNKALSDAHAKAVKIYEHLIKKFKGKRNVDWREAVTTYKEGTGHSWSGICSYNHIEDMPFGHLIEKSLRNVKDGEWRKPLKPKKKDFPQKTNKDHMFTDSYGEATVTFNDKERTVYWGVSENNRAVERARESVLGKLFFELLSKVTWTRGTGGQIVGNDEYNQESDGLGGGGNYLTAEYGPNVKRHTVSAGSMYGW